ncbi:hypothetical protein NQ315_005014 [Exocentrus adspersus]|uniref:Uncharacterized protein n=1 Tax=Exocentrus adspersus TaxID=1586481 RepID=A0AAV8VQS0_9CUCU|nr:hypothetical protein NQ315_005014 [Exocentrus adspersus]
MLPSPIIFVFVYLAIFYFKSRDTWLQFSCFRSTTGGIFDCSAWSTPGGALGEYLGDCFGGFSGGRWMPFLRLLWREVDAVSSASLALSSSDTDCSLGAWSCLVALEGLWRQLGWLFAAEISKKRKEPLVPEGQGFSTPQTAGPKTQKPPRKWPFSDFSKRGAFSPFVEISKKRKEPLVPEGQGFSTPQTAGPRTQKPPRKWPFSDFSKRGAFSPFVEISKKRKEPLVPEGQGFSTPQTAGQGFSTPQTAGPRTQKPPRKWPFSDFSKRGAFSPFVEISKKRKEPLVPEGQGFSTPQTAGPRTQKPPRKWPLSDFSKRGQGFSTPQTAGPRTQKPPRKWPFSDFSKRGAFSPVCRDIQKNEKSLLYLKDRAFRRRKPQVRGPKNRRGNGLFRIFRKGVRSPPFVEISKKRKEPLVPEGQGFSTPQTAGPRTQKPPRKWPFSDFSKREISKKRKEPLVPEGQGFSTPQTAGPRTQKPPRKWPFSDFSKRKGVRSPPFVEISKKRKEPLVPEGQGFSTPQTAGPRTQKPPRKWPFSDFSKRGAFSPFVEISKKRKEPLVPEGQGFSTPQTAGPRTQKPPRKWPFSDFSKRGQGLTDQLQRLLEKILANEELSKDRKEATIMSYVKEHDTADKVKKTGNRVKLNNETTKEFSKKMQFSVTSFNTPYVLKLQGFALVWGALSCLTLNYFILKVTVTCGGMNLQLKVLKIKCLCFKRILQ